jgi:hypothetical protein
MTTIPVAASTQDILDEIEAAKSAGHNFFGAYATDLVKALDWEHAQPFLSEDSEITREQWESEARTTDVAAAARSYMDFAIGKIVDERGLSASRNTEHARAWLFLAFGRMAAEELDDVEYGWYGRIQMRHAYAKLGLVAEWDAALAKAES